MSHPAYPDSPYIKPPLQATAHGRLPVRDLLENWIDFLEDLLDGRLDLEEREFAVSLVGVVGRLQRCRSELLKALGGDELLAQSQHRITRELLEQAVSLLREQPAWEEGLAEADELLLNLPTAPDEAEAAYDQWLLAATDLWDELDESEVVAALAAQQHIVDDQLNRWLQAAQSVLRREPGSEPDAVTLYGITTYLQTIAWLLGPDLKESQPHLASSAEKYLQVLDVHQQLEGYGPQADLNELWQLVTSLDQQPPEDPAAPASTMNQRLDAVPPWAEPAALQLAAAEPADEQAPISAHWTWTTPEGERWRAELMLPPASELTGHERAIVRFYHDDEAETPLCEIAGQDTYLDSTRAFIQQDGSAEFPLAQLPRDRWPPLDVGGELWAPEPKSPS